MQKFIMPTGERARKTLDVINGGRAVSGIPVWLINPMEHSHIDRIAGVPEGSYKNNPVPVYTKMLLNAGCTLIDQFIPENPLSMGSHGYEDDAKMRDRATAGKKEIVLDGMVIDSVEAAAEHREKFGLAVYEKRIKEFNEEKIVKEIIEEENKTQAILGNEMLKVPYHPAKMPILEYGAYGYEYYFMMYALYPELIERDFKIQADLCVLVNKAVARAYVEGGLPKLHRHDQDLADQKGTLVDIKSLDKIWFPQLTRTLEPLLKAGIRVIWHCDGMLMDMVPRLIECGISGFQGFQYEYGMDYEKICKMKDREGRDLFIVGGVSVTTTLPFGKPDDIKKEMKWLVEKGPKNSLALGGSSSIAPGVPWENMKTLIEGFKYYSKTN